MKYNYSSRSENCTWSDSMKYKAEKAFSKVCKFLEDDKIKIHIDADGDAIIVKAQAVTKSHRIIRAESTGSPNAFDALIHDVSDSLERQARRTKEKLSWKDRIRSSEFEIETSEGTFDGEMPSGIVKETQVVAESMTINKAIEALESAGYTWFIFRDTDANDNLTVVNKRLEGNYKLIRVK